MSTVVPTAPKNRLAEESSPYLIQHADNPVDWYPWGPEAFAKAKAEDKPILLSVGYAACHWCHVMAHESFEDEATAKLMNQLYVSVKVDREERPDVDDVYQHAVQLLGVGGGWPLTAFLTPDGRPFFGGTYFPKEEKYGRPSFQRVLHALHDAYKKEPDNVEHNAKALLGALAKVGAIGGEEHASDRKKVPSPDEAVALVGVCARRLLSSHDEVHGGIGTRPKFPNVSAIELWPRRWAHAHDLEYLTAFKRTLSHMANGGIYDHLGGGFARYSTDEKWLVPHFEKMLYDNAQLVRSYVDGYRILGGADRERCREVVEETLAYVRREMTAPEGCFFSTQDADSEDPAHPGHNEEGAFFVWTPDEIEAALGDVGRKVAGFYGVTKEGNFEQTGKSVLSRRISVDMAQLTPAALADARKRLWQAREQRPRPGLDDKVLTSWNGLMVSALAKAYEVFGDPQTLADARRAVDFLWQTMRDPVTGRLWRVWKQGKAPKILAFLDDYAYFAEALIDLYEAAGDRHDLERAITLTESACDLFWDPARRAWYLSGNDGEKLVHRPESHFDGAIPSGGAIATSNALRLAPILGGERGKRLQSIAEEFLAKVRGAVVNNPFGLSRSAACLDFLGTSREIVIVGPASDPSTQALLAAARAAYVPSRILIHHDPANPHATINPDLLAGKTAPAAYVCRAFTCDAPITDPAALTEKLSAPSSPEKTKIVNL